MEQGEPVEWKQDFPWRMRKKVCP